MIENGIGLPINKEDALEKLAFMLENGIGTSVDKNEAFFHYVELAKSKQSVELLDKCADLAEQGNGALKQIKNAQIIFIKNIIDRLM